jgi:hypothetical protein
VELLAWLEENALSTSVRESRLLYPTILALHSVGMAFLVGLSAAIDLRILGCAPRLPLAPMERFFPVMWLGCWVNALTGLVLLAAAATKHLTDPVMYVKLLLVALAVVILRLLQAQVFRGPTNPHVRPMAKLLAGTSLACWALAIVAGRLTAYTFFRFWE